jgi:hypothetical protein
MTVRRIGITAAALGMLAVPGSIVGAQTAGGVLTQLESRDYTVRSAAFYQIFSTATAGMSDTASLGPRMQRLAGYARAHPEVQIALIKLLEREGRPDPAKDALPEDAYIGDLIGSVAALRDPRAVKGLMGAITTGGMATGGLLDLGAAAVPSLLAKVHDPRAHFFARSAAADVLGVIATRSTLRADTGAIRSALLDALGDTNQYVRSSAVHALGAFHGPDVRRAVERIAATDPAVSVRANRRIFPVRVEAAAWLRRDDSVKVVHRR